MKTGLTILIAVVVALVALAAAVRLFEPRFAFFPFAGESETPADYGVPFESTTITTADGQQLRAWSLPHSQARADIVYFHGNGGNLSMWAPILANIHRQGYAVRAFDYRGYGLSTGKPTERGLYRDVDAVLTWISESRPPGAAGSDEKPLVYWGRSLGATMAAYAASVRAPGGLILESGFADARSLLRSSPILSALALFSTYRFHTTEWLQHMQRPVLVIHGDADRIVPFANGQRLFDAIAGPKRLVVIRGGDHNDAQPTDPRTYWEAVHSFIASLSSR